MSGNDLKRHDSRQAHEGPDHSAPYPVSRLAPSIELVDLARQIDKADRTINTRVHSKLRVIADQIKSLQDQARQVMEEARNDQDLHRVRCSFKKIPGHVYYLYCKEDGSRYFSILSPEDWQGKPPHELIGGFRLEADMSWVVAEEAGQGDDLSGLVEQFLGGELK